MKTTSLISRLLELLPYAAFCVLAALVRVAPLEWGFLAGRLLGNCAYRLAPPLRRQAIMNLRMAYSGEKSETEIRALARAHFASLGANLISSIKLASMPREDIRKRITLEIPQESHDLRKVEGRGWLAMISHIGCWEVFSHLGELISEYPMAAVYRPLPNRYLEAHFQRTRARYGVSLFARRRDLMTAHRFLKDGGAVGVLVDQHAGDAGVWAPFFGRLAATSPLAASLAVRAGVPIQPIAVYTTGVARWEVACSPPIPTEGANPNQLTAEINKALEAQVRLSPADWLWSHNRWKTPQPRFLLGNFHRGVAYPAGFSGPLKPFRILVASPSEPAEARASAGALELIKPSRPDAEIVVVCPADLEALWREIGCVDRVLPGSGDALAQDILSLGRIDAAFLFSSDHQHARMLRETNVPRLVGYRELQPLVNQAVPQKDSDPLSPGHYIDLVVSTGAVAKG